MAILDLFGLKTSLLIFQIINFLIIAFIIKKFLLKPLKRMLDERKLRIEQSLEDAENAKIALENAGAERKQILVLAKNDADKLMASTKASAEEKKDQFIKEAKNSSDKIIEEAKQKAAMEFENMNKEVGKISIDISNKIMTKVISELFSEKEKEAILEKALSKIEKTGHEKNIY